MKKISMLIFLVTCQIVIATTYYVGPTQTYTDIQSAINIATNGDSIIVDPGEYSSISYGLKNLTIASRYIENYNSYYIENTIISGNDDDVVSINSNGQSELNGFTITNGVNGIRALQPCTPDTTKILNCIIRNLSEVGILYTNGFPGSLLVDGCKITNCFSGIKILGFNTSTIQNSFISEIEEYGIFLYGTDPMESPITFFIDDCEISNCENEAIRLDFVEIIVNKSIFYSNNIVFREVYYVQTPSWLTINNSTISDNETVFSSFHNNSPTNYAITVSNSIIWANGNNLNIPTSDISYSNIQNGYAGTGNISEDPEFLDPFNDDYRLTWDANTKSPCINTGDPNSPLDPDGTRTDMGALYHHSDLKTYEFCGPYTLPHCGWTWLCFDILDIYNPEVTNQVQYLLDPLKLDLDHGEHEGLEFLYNQQGGWTYGEEIITSPKGYKIQTTDDVTLDIAGFRCPPDTEFPIYEGEDNWIGYFLEETQNVYDAFGSHHLDNIFSIQHQDWSIDSRRGWPDVNYTLSAGDMVIVKCDSDIESFVWQDPSRSRTEPFIVLFPELYTYTEEADYLPIYVELDENDLPDEIAVFVDNECQGARVVQHTFENICAYITELQSGSVEIEFAYYGRNARRRFTEYTVFNKITGSPETTAINLTNKQDHYYVSFRSGGDNSSGLPELFTSSNYPNPFNPSTVISYDLPQESKVSISIYNLKGQKVKELIEGSQSAGSYTVQWNGEDEYGKPVSSGIYYYRLQACGKTINRKMLLLK